MKFYTPLLALALLSALPLPAQESTATAPAATVCADAELEAVLAELKQKSESGDMAATQQLYTAYALEGHTEQAQAWAERYEQQLTAKAESGDAPAMMLLASSYLQGRDYMPQDMPLAIKWLVRAAEAGQPSAAYILGEIFMQQGNTAEAKKFYKQAYDAYAKLTSEISGEPTTTQRNALYWQGYMQLMGIGTEQNTAAGIERLKSADIAWAWSQLYKCYIKGMGVEKDLSQAITYARKLADEAGDGMMAWVTATAYLKGEGAPKDEALGRQYLEKAAQANIAQAIHHKGTLLLAEGKAKEAYDCFCQAASMGLPESMTEAAKLLLHGAEGVEKDEALALTKLQEASDLYNDPRAPYELGLYYDAAGEPELANNWYRIASERGVVEAMARRGLLHITPNSGVSWSPTQMYRWWRTGSDAGDPTCSLYLNLFLFVFIPVVLIFAFGVPIAVVHILNKRALQEEAQANEEQTDKPADK